MKLVGMKELKLKFRKLTNGVVNKLERNVELAALFLLRKSQEIVPVDTGALKASGKVWTNHMPHPTAFVGYATEYAIYVHEILHYYHEPPTQAKYLSAPLEWYRKEIVDIMIKGVKAEVLE